MALITGAQYIESIKKMRPNVYKWGKLIEDISTSPVTRDAINNTAKMYDNGFNPETEAIYTKTSRLTGEKCFIWNSLQADVQDLIDNSKMKRHAYNQLGNCPGPICAGWTCIMALWDVTYNMDKEFGTDYHKRLKDFLIFSEKNALAMAGAITDAKGNRSLKPGEQSDKDFYVHVKEVREDGIVISGMKNQICGVPYCNYMIVMPTTGFREEEKEFAVAAAVPRDAEGVTIVITRNPSDDRTEEEGWDAPESAHLTTYIIFEDVFVPNEHVFMCGEYKYAGACIGNFTAIYRAAIGACVAGQGDVIIGAALGMARANGLTQKPFQDKLTKMAINNETTYAVGLGAMAIAKPKESGVIYPDTLLAHVNKVHVATLPYDTKVLAQDIAGGIAETGCMPSYMDMMSPIYGKKLIHCLDAGVKGEDRVKMARLLEWLHIGGGVPACMHGGGSPDTAKAVVKAATKWDKYVDLARSLAKVEAPLKEEKKK